MSPGNWANVNSIGMYTFSPRYTLKASTSSTATPYFARRAAYPGQQLPHRGGIPGPREALLDPGRQPRGLFLHKRAVEDHLGERAGGDPLPYELRPGFPVSPDSCQVASTPVRRAMIES